MIKLALVLSWIFLAANFVLAQSITTTVQPPQAQTSTVAALPACNASLEGSIWGVTNALVPAALATVAGGGVVHVSVYCNGSNWIVL